MSARTQEAWGGEVRLPRWLHRLLKRPEDPGDTPEAVHEARRPQPLPTVAQNADKAAVGALSDILSEGRRRRR
jgi:hypothetical protein